ncbi:unnamed protein product [Chrysoparadoxa australica]
MIRCTTLNDVNAINEVAISSGLFSKEDIGVVAIMMADYFERNSAKGDGCIVDVDEDGKLGGMAYYTPAAATEGTWYLQMIAVDAALQGQGRGTRLIQHIEHKLGAAGHRLLLVETAGTDEFGVTRQFYVKNGYEEEARVRDYYAAGVDMVLYRKALTV